MIYKLTSFSRHHKILILLIIDSILIVSILLASFSIRLGYWYFPEENLFWLVFGSPIIAIPVFLYLGIYRAIVRYISFKALWEIAQAVSIYALIWGVLGLLAAIDGIPRSVILINWMLSIFAIIGLRVCLRSLLISKDNAFNTNDRAACKKVLIYGAGDAGIQLISALEHSKEFCPVGLIDDSKELQGNQIRGLTIFSINDIDNLINKLKVDEVLIALPSVSRTKRLNIIESLAQYQIIVRILPGMVELAEGKIGISDLRKVNINDLLDRRPIESNTKLLGKNITGQSVLVTGAGGSIGSELCRQILFLKPKLLILFEISEIALYTIEKELFKINIDSIDVYPILGNVNTRNRLNDVFKKFDVNTIYHAAAYKHVPMVEFNTCEGADNNIFGTLNCVQAAIDFGAETFVLISTDKAVRPTNTMGATKRIAELILQALAETQIKTTLTMVRFGNVLGSSGSVVPLFEKQIQEGGPITVTHKEVVRFFMTTTEAVQLVIEAGNMAKGGDVFLLEMGKSMNINDLAKKMVRLSGLEVKDELHPDGDIAIEYSGLRPGEKLYEEMLIGNDSSYTVNSKIMRANENKLEWDILKPILDKTQKAIRIYDDKKLQSLIIMLVPEFTPESRIFD